MRRLSDGGERADYSITDELAQLVDDRKLAAKLAGYMQRSEFEPFAVMIEQELAIGGDVFHRVRPGDGRAQGTWRYAHPAEDAGTRGHRG